MRAATTSVLVPLPGAKEVAAAGLFQHLPGGHPALLLMCHWPVQGTEPPLMEVDREMQAYYELGKEKWK